MHYTYARTAVGLIFSGRDNPAKRSVAAFIPCHARCHESYTASHVAPHFCRYAYLKPVSSYSIFNSSLRKCQKKRVKRDETAGGPKKGIIKDQQWHRGSQNGDWFFFLGVLFGETIPRHRLNFSCERLPRHPPSRWHVPNRNPNPKNKRMPQPDSAFGNRAKVYPENRTNACSATEPMLIRYIIHPNRSEIGGKELGHHDTIWASQPKERVSREDKKRPHQQ